MSTYLQSLKDRLVDLQALKASEEASSIPSVRYLDDLNVTIARVQADINQLTYARENPLVMVSGVMGVEKKGGIVLI